MAVAVLMLEALARQRGPPGRPAEEEPARARIAGCPDEIPDPLEPEHRIEDEEGDRVHAVRRVRRTGRDERRHRSGFGDAFLENLAVRRFLVIKERVHVDRLVQLAGV